MRVRRSFPFVCLTTALACTLALPLRPLQAAPVTLEQTISREDPRFQVAASRMTIGRDGMVYLSNLDPASMGPGWVVRLSRDGKIQTGADPGPAPMFVTANAKGIIATGNAHFTHAVTLRDGNFKILASNNEFTAEPGYFAPQHGEAGESGDFYALDANKKRIVRIDGAGKTVATYPYTGQVTEFRVHEKTESFYLFSNDWTPLRKVGFDGELQWEAKIAASGGFDVDAAGTLHTLAPTGEEIRMFAPDGTPAGFVPLQLGEIKSGVSRYPFKNLRLWGGEVFLKRNHPTEMLLRFELKTGALQQTITARHELLSVSYPAEVWTAGSTQPFSIDFTDTVLGAKPQWRVWARSAGALNWRELKLQEGKLNVPAAFGGLYQLKVTPETLPWQPGSPPEYIVQGWVEVRWPDSRGTLNVWTPQNRTWYGAGEAVPFTVLSRAKTTGTATPATIRLIEDGTGRVLATVATSLTVGKPVAMQLPTALTSALLPGQYRLEASAAGWTPVAQYLNIGRGLEDTRFWTIKYGDYNAVWPNDATTWSAPDIAAAHASRTAGYGLNLMVERLGFNASQQDMVLDNALRTRLQNDPDAAAPEKASIAAPYFQTLAAYGAHGTRQMSILLGNDAGLPIGSGYSTVPMEQLLKNLGDTTKALQPYPAFRGWSWAANWWLFDHRGANAAPTPELKAEYQASVKKAYETGEWNPVIDRIAAIRWKMAPEATAQFNKALRTLNPKLKTAVAAPYRSGEVYPPQTFSNVDEVDLQAQWEQIAPPYYPAHNAEYYKRPGKPAWGHPEVWNDSGTGEQLASTWFQMAMRGASGVGYANHLLNWQPEDARSPEMGSMSVVRSMNNLLRQYGPWLGTLQGDDRVAIPVSSRMLKLDSWDLHHYWSVFEAFFSCLHAHQPASIVFVEDLKPDSLRAYSAIILAGHKVQLEPALQTAVANAHAAGIKVLYDGSSRASLFKGYTPLGISFDKVGRDSSMGVGGDESGYPRLPEYMRQNLPALSKGLKPVSAPAKVDNDEVWVTQRKTGAARLLFVVNNSTPALEPDQLWRMTLYSGTRVPVQARVQLPKTAAAIYDVFAMKRVTPQNGAFTADLRTLPGRVYAMLPAPIGAVALRGPAALRAGESFAWWAQVRDSSGKPIAAGTPLRLRLLAGSGSVLKESYTVAPASGVGGNWTAPLNAPAGNLTLEATELFSGKAARLKLAVKPVAALALPATAPATAKPVAAKVSGTPANLVDNRPAASEFGAHARDMILAGGGKVAVVSAMNWDNNLYGIDTATGKVLWKQKFGQYFAFAPQPLANGFAVQGFDFTSPEGYALYMADDSGKAERRFALYGLPTRAPFRMYPQGMHGRENNFAASPGGAWFASAGSLGLAAWNRDGKLLWSQDDWKQPRTLARINANSGWDSTVSIAPALLAADESTLIAVTREAVSARGAQDGKTLWTVPLPIPAQVRRIRASRDGKTLAVLTEAQGGTVYVLRAGAIERTLLCKDTYDFELAPDGSSLAVLSNNALKLYDTGAGLRWVFPADDRLRFARYSVDGGRLAVTTDLGTVYVLDNHGNILHERDARAVAVPQWLPDGDLLLATWSGQVTRLDGKYMPRWNAALQPSRAEKRDTLLAADGTPQTRITGWGNAEKQPLPISPNLLTVDKAFVGIPTVERSPQNDLRLLTDGKTTVPALPWIYPGELNQWAGLRFFNPIDITLPAPVRATGVTLFEDPAHPNSWLRDADLEYFDAGRNEWVFLQTLLSDSATHTHKFARPVESKQFRIILPVGLYGNLRLSEIVLHGEAL